MGENDKHEYLQKLLDRKKRAHGGSNPETNGSFEKRQRKSSAFCTTNFEHEPNSNSVEPQSEETEPAASCKLQDIASCVSPCVKLQPEEAGTKHFSKQLFVEIFCGTGGLTANIKALGVQGIGIDSSVSTACKSPVLKLDLTKSSGQQILWEVLNRPNICGVHLAPPCGTSSRARDIPRAYGPSPLPLRSEAYPDGLPSLRGLDLKRVRSANCLYRLTGEVLRFCLDRNIPCSVENPARSHFWATKSFTEPIKDVLSQLEETYFHHCMYGSKRRKYTKFLHTCKHLNALERYCDGRHWHLPWGFNKGKWATKSETAYPNGLCQAYASCFKNYLLATGHIEPPSSIQCSSMHINDVKLNQVGAGKQPRGKVLPPLVSEFAAVFSVVAKADILPGIGKLGKQWHIPPSAKVRGPYAINFFPAGSKVLRSKFQGGNNADRDDSFNEIAVGVHWEPSIFVKMAIEKQHPREVLQVIPDNLVDTIEFITHTSDVDMARYRTAEARKWVLKAKEFIDQETKLKSSLDDHCKKILSSKKLVLFREMLKECGHADETIASDISRGFSLMGDLPKSGVFADRASFATLTKEQVKSTAKLNRLAIFNGVKAPMDEEITQGVYDATIKELEQGWLRGPIDPKDLGPHSIVTRRFGVKQSSTESDGTRSVKIRPIDDFTESLVNLTNGSDESITIHGVDFIVASICERIKKLQVLGLPSNLVAKTVDLRKAYKQLPIDLKSLDDSYLCVRVPGEKRFEIYQCVVLPFGARAAVTGFCRSSFAIWSIGVSLFKIHWSCYFDDFFAIEKKELARHTSFIIDSLFSALGWSTSVEKNSDFSSLARALGVVINLADTHLLRVSVSNSEHRGKDISDMIDGMLAKNFFRKSEMESLRGRLVFAEGQLFGRIAQRSLRDLSLAIASGSGAVDDTLRKSLVFLKDRVANAPPRIVACGPRRMIHLYTDASHESSFSGVGAVCYDSAGTELWHFGDSLSIEQVRRVNIDDKGTIISELEAMAVYAGVNQLASEHKHLDVICFIDNDAVLASMIKAGSPNDVMQNAASSVATIEVTHDLRLWFERVPSYSNPADGPSRGSFFGLASNNKLEICIEDLVCKLTSI